MTAAFNAISSNATALVSGSRLDGATVGVLFDQCVMAVRQVCADGGECVAGRCINGEYCACPDGSACRLNVSSSRWQCADRTPCVSGVADTKALQPVSAPCFRATGSTRLRIHGRNFGSGKTTSNELKGSRLAPVVQRVLISSAAAGAAAATAAAAPAVSLWAAA